MDVLILKVSLALESDSFEKKGTINFNQIQTSFFMTFLMQ